MLETALDHNDLVFRYVTDADGRIRIEASILLYTDVDGNQIYVYIDQEKDRNSDYYCRSFVANPSFDRKKGLKKKGPRSFSLQFQFIQIILHFQSFIFKTCR